MLLKAYLSIVCVQDAVWEVQFGLNYPALLEDSYGVSSDARCVGFKVDCGTNGLVGSGDGGEHCISGTESSVTHEDKVRD